MTESTLPKPGDIIFCHGIGFVPTMIRFGERLRHPARRGHHWSHVAIMADPDPKNGLPRVIQAGARGVEYGYLKDIDIDRAYVEPLAFPSISDDDVIRPDIVLAQARLLVGAKYGWLTIMSIVINLLTPSWFRFPDFRRGATYICSTAAAWCLHAAGANINTNDIYQIMPSELWALATNTSDH